MTTVSSIKLHRISEAARLNAALATNIRTCARERGYTRRTLRSATGMGWLRFQRMWFGLNPVFSTVLVTNFTLGVEPSRIWPSLAATA